MTAPAPELLIPIGYWGLTNDSKIGRDRCLLDDVDSGAN